MEFTSFKITGVDRDHIERDSTMANAYKYAFILSGRPDDLWIKFFHHAYRMSSYGKKRQYSIIGNQVVFTVLGDDHMQAQLDFLKELVSIANEEYCKQLERKEEERREEETRKRREQETIQRFRNEVDKMNF